MVAFKYIIKPVLSGRVDLERLFFINKMFKIGCQSDLVCHKHLGYWVTMCLSDVQQVRDVFNDKLIKKITDRKMYPDVHYTTKSY